VSRPCGASASRCAAGVTLVVLTAGCACSSDTPPAAPPATVATTTTAPPPPPVYPLRGTVADDPVVAARPALVIKVDDTAPARPQAGLTDADLIYEEKVEGPFSRFATVFQSRQPEVVGPVRSGRTTDVNIVASLNRPLYAYSGANGRTEAVLREAPMVNVGYNAFPQAYERGRGRSAPYNLWTFPARLRERTPSEAGPPPPAFTFGDTPPPADAVPGPTATYDFGAGGTHVSFSWDDAAKGWARTQDGTRHVDVDGNGLTPANVVLQIVDYVNTGDADVAGSPVPEAQLVGQGFAWVLTRGVAVKAVWSRPDPAKPTQYMVAGGAPVVFAPGQTWVALVPAAGVGWQVAGADGVPVA
jgi:hypothetical protein